MDALRSTTLALVVGACGALIGYYLSLPAYPLLGPALLISAVSLTGLHLHITEPVRNAGFALAGVSVGSGFDTNALQSFLRWPIAFVALAIMLVVAMLICMTILRRGFGFDRRSAVLATTPGHLSFVMALSTSLDLDSTRIIVVQAIRLLSLTLLVPFVALAMGVDMGEAILPNGVPMPVWQIVGLVAAGLALAFAFSKWRIPAPFFLAPLIVSACGHVTEITPGVMPHNIALASLVIIGTLIGTRFSGISLQQLRANVLAGVTITLIMMVLVTVVAVPIAMLLPMPPAHVIVAFAPGGLETMVAMGAVLGANPGFVVACHIGRLFWLSFLVPVLIGRAKSF